MIKAVLFDFGGVLSEGGRAGGIQHNIAKLCGRPVEDIKIKDLHDRFVRGQMSESEYFDEINRRYPCATPVTAASFVSGSDVYTPSLPVYDLAKQLRQNNIITGILSNMYPMSAAKLRAEGLYQGFDPVIVSSDEQLAKPDPAIFRLALKRLGLPGNQVLFIDDQERFRPVSEGFGMHFITAVSPEQIVHDTRALIQKENRLTLK